MISLFQKKKRKVKEKKKRTRGEYHQAAFWGICSSLYSSYQTWYSIIWGLKVNCKLVYIYNLQHLNYLYIENYSNN